MNTAPIKARDVMATKVVCVDPSTPVKDAAKLLLRHRISAVPVVDEAGGLVGILSEGDLLHRDEAGTQRAIHGGSARSPRMRLLQGTSSRPMHAASGTS